MDGIKHPRPAVGKMYRICMIHPSAWPDMMVICFHIATLVQARKTKHPLEKFPFLHFLHYFLSFLGRASPTQKQKR
jgi:hypothetical protein